MTTKPKTYRVGYWIEQGYAITVAARSPAHAERLVRQRLDQEADTLDGSERVHHDDSVCGADQIGGAS
jgi:hypothetical protein